MSMQVYSNETQVDAKGNPLAFPDASTGCPAAFGDAPPPTVSLSMDARINTRWGKGTGRGPLAECSVCGYVFPVREMTKSKGLWYCRAQGCADDLLKPVTEAKR